MALPQALKGPGTLLEIIGLGSMLASRRGWLLPLAFAIYLLFISYLSLWWVRWALPLVPLATIGAVFLCHRLELRLRPRLPALVTYGARIAVAALLLVPIAIPTAEMVWSRATTDDVRVEAASGWTRTSRPVARWSSSRMCHRCGGGVELLFALDGEVIRWQEFSDQVRPARFFGSLGDGSRDMTPEELMAEFEARDVDYVLLSSSWINRYGAEREDYPDEWAVYETLFEEYPTVKTFRDGEIVVLDAKQE